MVLRWVDGDRSQLSRSRVCPIGQDESHAQRPTTRSTQCVQVAMVQIAAHLRLGVGQEQQRQERFSLRARSDMVEGKWRIAVHDWRDPLPRYDAILGR